jgi:hypothetical protein
MADEIKQSGYDALWGWFGLSYASFLTMPRVMMHAMPDDWQARMAQLCEEWDATWCNQPDIGSRVQVTDGKGKLIKTPRWILNYRHPDTRQLDAMKGPSNG